MKMKTISVLYCLLCATWTEGAEINVEGFERGQVSIRCPHRFAWKNNKYLCKDPCKDNKDILVTVESGSRAESGRITLVDLGTGDFIVTFRQLQLSDSGTYLCGVDRPGFDTFTSVYLTVNKAIVVETTTVIPEVSPTWTYENISNSTQLSSGTDTSRPTNLSTASNCTNGGEQNISTGTVLYSTIGAVALLTILMLATCFRKHRKKSKPQPQVCFNSRDLTSADKREALSCEYNENGEEVQSMKRLSERLSRTRHPKQDAPAPASTEAECSVPLHIYENIRCSKSAADSRYSAANAEDEHNISSRIHIKPMPATISERTDGGPLGKHTNKPTATKHATSRPAESCTSTTSACHSRSCSDSKEGRPRSLWFGLDLSGTV